MVRSAEDANSELDVMSAGNVPLNTPGYCWVAANAVAKGSSRTVKSQSTALSTITDEEHTTDEKLIAAADNEARAMPLSIAVTDPLYDPRASVGGGDNELIAKVTKIGSPEEDSPKDVATGRSAAYDSKLHSYEDASHAIVEKS